MFYDGSCWRTGNLLSLVAKTSDTHPQEKSIYDLKETPRPPSWLATSPVFLPQGFLSRHTLRGYVQWVVTERLRYRERDAV